MKAIRWLLKLMLVMITLPLILAVWLAKWFAAFLHKRICRFAPVEVLTLTIKITASRTEPTLRLLAVYQ